MWITLEADVVDMFEELSRAPDLESLRMFCVRDTRPRKGRPPSQTAEQRREKRRALEQRRRDYKTAKQREYTARKKAA